MNGTRLTSLGLACSALWLVFACGGSPPSVPVGDSGVTRMDAGRSDADAGPPSDGAPADAPGRPDARVIVDAWVGPDGGRGDGGGMACPDAPPTPERACLDEGACDGSEICVLPRVGVCPPCVDVIDECDDVERTCEAGFICVTRRAHCEACPSRTCEAACTAGSCPEGESCGGDGRCVADHCDLGYGCPRNSRCDGSAPGADDHGCLALTCVADTDCDCGFCARGVCAEGYGECTSRL